MAGDDKHEAGQDATPAVCTFIKKSKGSRAARKKRESSSSEGDGEGQVVVKERKKASGLVAGSKTSRKRRKTDGNSGGSEDDADDLLVLAKADGRVYGVHDDSATRTLEIDGPAQSSTGGKSHVSSFIKPGPRQGPSNIRVTQRFDYQPDVCKDYKETGYCGFGDTCKFLHDRSDYKTGWQLEREWEQGAYGKRDNLEVESSEEEEDLPFACYICREPFNDPVVTKCQHYFCAKCAVDHHKRDKKCFVCSAPTNGIFNIAKNIVEKLKKKDSLDEAEEQNFA